MWKREDQPHVARQCWAGLEPGMTWILILNDFAGSPESNRVIRTSPCLPGCVFFLDCFCVLSHSQEQLRS